MVICTDLTEEVAKEIYDRKKLRSHYVVPKFYTMRESDIVTDLACCCDDRNALICYGNLPNSEMIRPHIQILQIRLTVVSLVTDYLCIP